jgi:SAM-dependent methyltransferase
MSEAAHSDILADVGAYYTSRLLAHGSTPAGVDWNSAASQELRFNQLLRIVEPGRPFSINDYGCGYGALIGALDRLGVEYSYSGYDVSAEMVAAARRAHAGRARCRFTSADDLTPADYSVASGIFNVRLRRRDDEWKAYLLDTLDRLASLSRRGFAFNVLTSYSDADHMRPDLFYADPCWLFQHCKTAWSRHVALLHDYGLYEFTLLVRRLP